MFENDNKTVGFNSHDADALGRMIETREGEYIEGKVRSQTASLAVFLYTLTSAFSSGTGTATIRTIDDATQVATGASVVDTLSLFGVSTGIGTRGICVKSGGAYYAIGPYVTKVRWDAPDLEFTKDDETTWINIDTAIDCE